MAESLAARYQQITEAIHDINSVVTRIDERLDIFVDKLNGLEKKIEHHVENCPVRCAFSETLGRIKVLESKNGNLMKQELRETIREVQDATKETCNEMKTQISDLQQAMEEIKLQAKDLTFVSTTSANKWKTIGMVLLYGVAPLIYIVLGAILLKWWGLQTPPGP